MPPASASVSADAADQRVGGQPAEGVGAAALEAHNQIATAGAARARPAAEARRAPPARAHLPRPRHPTACALKLRTRRGSRLAACSSAGELVALASETDHQHGARVGVGGERCQNPPRVQEVIPQLRAAERVGEGVHSVHTPSEPLAGDFGNALRGVRRRSRLWRAPRSRCACRRGRRAADSRGRCDDPRGRGIRGSGRVPRVSCSPRAS